MHNHHPHPKFSIITVTYNAAKVLEDTIQSIVTQTYKNLEYIIVDGGSTDETLDIIHKYQEHITTVISEPDQGLYDAMNKGIKLATGDYLCFLNAGDGLHEDDTLLQWYIPSMEQPCREYYMEKQKLWTVKGIFYICAACPHPQRLPGKASSKECWFAIKPFSPAVIW